MNHQDSKFSTLDVGSLNKNNEIIDYDFGQ